jgi:hypothetical protein
VAFGWAVKSTLGGSDRSGFLGRAAVEIASFPTTVMTVVGELVGRASGDFKDKDIRVEREPNADYTGFVPISTAPGINVDGLLIRANPDRMTKGWRLLAGVFTVDGEIKNSALLLSPELEVVREWSLEEIPVDGLEPRPKFRKFVHGLEVLPDGSLIFTFDGSISLQRIDVCGRRQWTIGGSFHHSVTLDDEHNSVWTFSSGRTIAQVAVEDGTILRQIPIEEVISANPMIDVLEIRRQHATDLGRNSRNTTGRWLTDPFHFNDVDPLPAALVSRFPGFKAGDLLVSSRSLNLVFVLDPNSLQVKWWRIGAVQRQHDPDWLPNGKIMILNNRMSQDFSEIITIDPVSFERATLYDGRRSDFYTRIRGKHQLLGSGALVVTSPQQGRAFETDASGEMVFEVVNLKSGSETTNYVISELRWLPTEYFDQGRWKCD